MQIDDPVVGWYYISASNGVCDEIDSLQISFTSENLTIEGDTVLCRGEVTVLTALNNDTNVTFVNFNWQADSIITSGNGTSSVVVQPSITQYVYLTAEANDGCIISDSVEVYVSYIDPLSVVATISDTIVPTGEEVTLSAEPDGYSYSWSPALNVENPNAQETTATVYETTIFTVIISDGVCTKTASVKVNPFPYICDEPFIFVPNAFTPNGDGENDLLIVRSLIVEDIIFRVYNRWGEMVYETNSMHTSWDGTFRGKMLDPDVYDYYLEGHCIDGQEFLIKGNITLIR